MLGLLLAGGTGSRLWPTTMGASKQLLNVFNKPMVYYSLSTIFLAGIRNVIIVTDTDNRLAFERLLGDGGQFGATITYAVQDSPRGIPDALNYIPETLRQQKILLALGDNVFYGQGVGTSLANKWSEGATIFGINVPNPSEYGVVYLDREGRPVSLSEKPENPTSSIAITGLYFLDESAIQRVGGLSESKRGELEVTDLLTSYLVDGKLEYEPLPRGTAWLDTGKAESLARASQYVEAVEANQGLLVGSPHEAAWRNGWITTEELTKLAKLYERSDYGSKILRIASPKSY
jgi:glucose-1-phosphate thymidylyltransferase